MARERFIVTIESDVDFSQVPLLRGLERAIEDYFFDRLAEHEIDADCEATNVFVDIVDE